MTFRLFAAALLALLPAVAFAQACDHGMKERVSSCADGYVWDSAAGACVEQVNS